MSVRWRSTIARAQVKDFDLGDAIELDRQAQHYAAGGDDSRGVAPPVMNFGAGDAADERGPVGDEEPAETARTKPWR